MVDGVLLKVDAESDANAELFNTVNGMVVIAGGAFEGCSDITKVYIVKGIVYMNLDAFAGLDIKVAYFETEAGMTKFVTTEEDSQFCGLFPEDIYSYFYSDTSDARAFYYDANGNIKYWNPNNAPAED